MREPQGVASLALGYVLHWAFSPPLLNPKFQYVINLYVMGLINSKLASPPTSLLEQGEVRGRGFSLY